VRFKAVRDLNWHPYREEPFAVERYRGEYILLRHIEAFGKG
jgi:hypothetical protein